MDEIGAIVIELSDLRRELLFWGKTRHFQDIRRLIKHYFNSISENTTAY